MFDFLVDSVDNALSAVGNLVEGECPSRHQVAKLIADGVSIAAIAEATGFSMEVIEAILDEDIDEAQSL